MGKGLRSKIKRRNRTEFRNTIGNVRSIQNETGSTRAFIRYCFPFLLHVMGNALGVLLWVLPTLDMGLSNSNHGMDAERLVGLF